MLKTAGSQEQAEQELTVLRRARHATELEASRISEERGRKEAAAREPASSSSGAVKAEETAGDAEMPPAGDAENAAVTEPASSKSAPADDDDDDEPGGGLVARVKADKEKIEEAASGFANAHAMGIFVTMKKLAVQIKVGANLDESIPAIVYIGETPVPVMTENKNVDLQQMVQLTTGTKAPSGAALGAYGKGTGTPGFSEMAFNEYCKPCDLGQRV